MKTSLLAAAALGMTLLTGCLTEDMRSPQRVFTVSDVSVPADTIAGSVIYKIPVTSTESWSVLPDPTRTWVNVYLGECLNTTGVEQTTYIELLCDDNDAYSPRTTDIKLVSATGQKTFTLTQRAKVNRLSIDGPAEYEIDAENVDPIYVSIKSNTDWTAAVADSSTMKMTLSPNPTVGRRDSIFKITPVANYAADTVKIGYVSIVAADVAPLTLKIIQKQNSPILTAYASDLAVTCLPEDTTGTVILSANLPWKAEIAGGATIEGLQLDTLEGGYGKNQALGFKMNPNTGQTTRTAQINVSLKDHPEISVTFSITQYAGFSLKIDLKHVADSASCPLQPYSAEDKAISLDKNKPINNVTGRANVYKYDYAGSQYLFEIKAAGYYIAPSATASKFITNKGYMKLPALDGYRIGYVGFTSVGTSKAYSITSDVEGTLEIGSKTVFTKDTFNGWVLNASEYNKPYYLWYWTSSCQHNDLVIIYVK